MSREELAKPEPEFVPPALSQRIQGSIRDLESTSNAPNSVQLHQLDLAKQALADATRALDKLVKEDVPRLNKTMADAQVPYVSVPER